jgi:hypothetical protein
VHGHRPAPGGSLNGSSGVIVLRGAPGIGKSALLEYAVTNARDFAVARVTGVESEVGLGFAAVHQLVLPFLDHVVELPEPQRDSHGRSLLRIWAVPTVTVQRVDLACCPPWFGRGHVSMAHVPGGGAGACRVLDRVVSRAERSGARRGEIVLGEGCPKLPA